MFVGHLVVVGGNSLKFLKVIYCLLYLLATFLDRNKPVQEMFTLSSSIYKMAAHPLNHIAMLHISRKH